MQAAPSFNRDIRDVIRMDPRVSLDRDDDRLGPGPHLVPRRQRPRQHLHRRRHPPERHLRPQRHRLLVAQLDPDSVRRGPRDAGPVRSVRRRIWRSSPAAPSTSSRSRAPTGSTAAPSTNSPNNGLRGSKCRRPPRCADPARQALGRVARRADHHATTLFFFGAYEHQAAGQSQDDGPAGAGFANEITGVSVGTVQRDFAGPARRLRNRHRPAGAQPAVHERAPVRPRRLADHRRHRLELTYQRLKENTVKTRRLQFTRFVAARGRPQQLLNSGTNSKYYSARLYSNWTDRISTELRYAHSNIQDIQDPVGGGEAQSGNPIPRIIVGVDNPPGTARDGSRRSPGPGFSRTANDLKTKLDQYPLVANYDAGDHKLKVGFEANHANLFNLFVQSATGTCMFKNVNDLRNGLLSPGNSTGNPTGTFITGVRRSGALRQLRPPAETSTMRQPRSAGRSIRSYVQDDWRATDDAEDRGGRAARLVPRRPSEGQPELPASVMGSATTPASTPSIRWSCRASASPTICRKAGPSAAAGSRAASASSRAAIRLCGSATSSRTTAWPSRRARATSPARHARLDRSTSSVGGVFTGFPDCALNDAQGRCGGGQRFHAGRSIPNIKMPTVWRANIGYQADLELRRRARSAAAGTSTSTISSACTGTRSTSSI